MYAFGLNTWGLSVLLTFCFTLNFSGLLDSTIKITPCITHNKREEAQLMGSMVILSLNNEAGAILLRFHPNYPPQIAALSKRDLAGKSQKAKKASGVNPRF